jgi:hypothetical protein
MEIQELKNKLNLVFDNWNDGIPNPNGDNIFPEYFLTKADFISGTYDVDIQNCKIEDVLKNKNIKFFYLVEHKECSIRCVLSEKSVISKEIIDLVNNTNNLNIFFISSHESYNDEDFVCLKKFIIDNNIDQNKVYVVNNNALTEVQVNKNDLKINYHSNIHIPTWYSNSIKNLETNFKENKNGKFFICLNNMRKLHRHVILSLLKNLNIINDVNWSFGKEADDNKSVNINEFKKLISDEKLNLLKDDIDYFYDVKHKTPDFEITEESTFYVNDIPELKNDQENSYINIVTESIFLEEDVVQITEKSLKPFLYYQIPIFCATHNHVDVLRKKYDFDMFDDIVNHDYDNIKDNKERMDKIIIQIQTLNGRQSEIKKMYPLLKERMEKNKIKLLDIVKIKDDNLFYKKITNG